MQQRKLPILHSLT